VAFKSGKPVSTCQVPRHYESKRYLWKEDLIAKVYRISKEGKGISAKMEKLVELLYGYGRSQGGVEILGMYS
jgi:hypothetical protein